jgi:hypothetical protein
MRGVRDGLKSRPLSKPRTYASWLGSRTHQSVYRLVGSGPDSSTVRATAVSSTRWAAFVEWGARLYGEREEFDEEERNYKLRIAANVALARRSLLGEHEWLDDLKHAFARRNNLTHWHTHDHFLGWCVQDPGPAAELLRSIWGEWTSVAVALAHFDRRLPGVVLSGPTRFLD